MSVQVLVTMEWELLSLVSKIEELVMDSRILFEYFMFGHQTKTKYCSILTTKEGTFRLTC
ncbi:hypothetical protein F8388_023032 [Cannabis sativa]|uniref:Uncharacterized protein n=1 Tax=Cannabis sativa TaxID=3483 RepID=A0A7J6HSR7_CANSA|nr:hypothetical protein F8388_023032 [Cannabis sativa]KAF4397789.1 hypothetical protein G4B88_017270 [Cannabis sativa]